MRQVDEKKVVESYENSFIALESWFSIIFYVSISERVVVRGGWMNKRTKNNCDWEQCREEPIALENFVNKDFYVVFKK